MKKIGIIGGLAWPSTITYYRVINQEVERLTGHTPELILMQPDFHEIEKYQEMGEWYEVEKVLGELAERLEKAGADLIIMASNTVHQVYDGVRKKAGVPVLHIVDSLGEKLNEDGIERIGLLGTIYTMEMEYFRGRLRDSYGIESVVPSPDNERALNECIFGDITGDNVSDDTKGVLRKCVDDILKQSVQAIVLGCTELDLISDYPCEVPIYDTTMIHCMAAVDEIVE